MSTMVRWIAVVLAVVGISMLGGHRAMAQDERPGDPEPIRTIVTVWDCPYQGADLWTECTAAVGAVVSVVADGVPVEGSGASTDYLDSGFASVVVQVPAIGASLTASTPGASVTLLAGELTIGGCDGVADCGFINLVRVDDAPVPSDTTFLVVVDANCPVADADVSDLCTRVEGSVVHVAVDGVEIAGSPRATEVNGIGFYSADFDVPTGATLTVWAEPNGDGYAPAPGYDPLVIAPDAFVTGSCGGEASCPYVYLINVPVDGGSEPVEEPVASEPTPDVDDGARADNRGTGSVGGEVVTRLPDTGTGPTDGANAVGLPVQVGMAVWTVLSTMAVILVGPLRRRRPTR